ncbi:hypothetical protein ACFLY6_00035 [Candidatus Dependentiae bacterium]
MNMPLMGGCGKPTMCAISLMPVPLCFTIFYAIKGYKMECEKAGKTISFRDYLGKVIGFSHRYSDDYKSRLQIDISKVHFKTILCSYFTFVVLLFAYPLFLARALSCDCGWIVKRWDSIFGNWEKKSKDLKKEVLRSSELLQMYTELNNRLDEKGRELYIENKKLIEEREKLKK